MNNWLLKTLQLTHAKGAVVTLLALSYRICTAVFVFQPMKQSEIAKHFVLNLPASQALPLVPPGTCSHPSLFSQTSNMNLINVISLLVAFQLYLNFICLFYVYVYVFYDLIVIHYVLNPFSSCKHVHLSCVLTKCVSQ